MRFEYTFALLGVQEDHVYATLGLRMMNWIGFIWGGGV